MTELKYPEEDYVNHNPFFGEEGDMACRNAKLVKVRKEHGCLFGENGDRHKIQPGERARYETALVDGSYWGRYYICIPCMDKIFADLFGDETDEQDED
jgi:hypothetical protein